MVGSARVQQAAGPVAEHYLSIIKNLGSKTCSYESFGAFSDLRGANMRLLDWREGRIVIALIGMSPNSLPQIRLIKTKASPLVRRKRRSYSGYA